MWSITCTCVGQGQKNNGNKISNHFLKSEPKDQTTGMLCKNYDFVNFMNPVPLQILVQNSGIRYQWSLGPSHIAHGHKSVMEMTACVQEHQLLSDILQYVVQKAG